MTYDEALKYIHGVSNFFCKPGLERITALCDMLGHPEKDLKFIHVAGTNGKGSFCSMMDSVLRTAGYKVGLYTSPYIYEFNERMRVNGENISNDTLCELTEYVKQFADTMEDSPTEFELITAIAFEYFKREAVDVVVLEVGMGGRFDSTNIIKNPLLSVITGIALDHTAFLGDTVEAIAGEKSGIIKDHAPVIYGGEDMEAREVIRKAALERGSEFFETDYSALSVKKADLSGTVFDYRENKDVHISLLGLYQPKNASIVLDGIELLRKRGLKISDEAVRRGLTDAKWRARFEIIDRDPTVIFDGAHNPQGIRAAVDSIKAYFGAQKVCVLTGVLRDKDYNVIAKTLAEVAGTAFTITPENQRALPAEEYAGVLNSFGINAIPCKNIAEALTCGKEASNKKNTALCCLGSLYTYVDVIKSIK